MDETPRRESSLFPPGLPIQADGSRPNSRALRRCIQERSGGSSKRDSCHSYASASFDEQKRVTRKNHLGKISPFSGGFPRRVSRRRFSGEKFGRSIALVGGGRSSHPKAKRQLNPFVVRWSFAQQSSGKRLRARPHKIGVQQCQRL